MTVLVFATRELVLGKYQLLLFKPTIADISDTNKGIFRAFVTQISYDENRLAKAQFPRSVS